MDPTSLPSNPQDDARPEILGVTLTMTCLALVTVAARIYVRLGVIKNFGWDDIIMSISVALFVALEAIIVVEVKHGHGRHIGDVPPEDYMVGLKYNFISQPIVFVCTNLIKLSIGAALLRIAATKFWRVLIWSIIGVMIFYTAGAFFTIIFQCQPIEMQWDPNVDGTCWEPSTLQGLAYTSIALNILTDLLFAIIIPLPMLWALNLNRRTKAALLFVLSLGIFACAAAAVRLVYIASYGVRDDYLWDTRKITIWSVNESSVGIIAGSLPSLKPLFKSIIGSTKRYASGVTPHFRSGGGSRSMFKSTSSRVEFSANLDDNDSERHLNVGRNNAIYEGYAMDDYPRDKSFFAIAESDASPENEKGMGSPKSGIMRTTTTTLSYQEH